jgi:hypothetical protein
LSSEAEGRALLKDLCAHQEIWRLILTNFKGFDGSTHGCGEVTVLTKTLHQNSAQGGMRLNHQNT